MTGPSCSTAAGDLAVLAARLDLAGRALLRQATLPLCDFEGLAGTAFRRHTARSAVVAADAARDVSLLAGALADLGHGLDAAGELRERAATVDPGSAPLLLARADRVEDHAQDAWRVALGRFEGAVNGPPGAVPSQPEESHPPPAESGPGAEPDAGQRVPGAASAAGRGGFTATRGAGPGPRRSGLLTHLAERVVPEVGDEDD